LVDEHNRVSSWLGAVDAGQLSKLWRSTCKKPVPLRTNHISADARKKVLLALACEVFPQMLVQVQKFDLHRIPEETLFFLISRAMADEL